MSECERKVTGKKHNGRNRVYGRNRVKTAELNILLARRFNLCA